MMTSTTETELLVVVVCFVCVLFGCCCHCVLTKVTPFGKIASIPHWSWYDEKSP